MTKPEQLHLAYITSMATGGLAGFNHRELTEMRRLQTDVELYVTKYRPGPYMPAPGIPVQRIAVPSILARQPIAILSKPAKYFKLLKEAVAYQSVPDFGIAQSWAHKMLASRRNWIHCHWGDHKLYIGYYCHRLCGIPLSVTLHGYDLYANPNWKMLEVGLRACSRIITISNHNKRLLTERFGEKIGSRVQVVRLSADLPPIEDIRNRCHLLIVGGFQQRKGYDILLRALNKLGRPDIHLWIAGYKGPVDVPGMVKELALEDRVTLFGHVSDDVLRTLYTFCDIFCMPSRFDKNGVGEGLPVSLMEAMSYGKPIIASRHTGIPELVPDILVAENDVNGLAEGIRHLVDDPDLRKAMGVRNRNIIERDFSNRNILMLLQQFSC